MIRVLVVDDSLTIRKTVAERLRAAGLQVIGEVADGREWMVERDGRVAPTLFLSDTDSVTLSMNFSRFFNPGVTFSGSAGAVDDSGNDLPISKIRFSADRKKIYFNVTAADLAPSTTYRMRCSGTTSDANAISGVGVLKTRPRQI